MSCNICAEKATKFFVLNNQYENYNHNIKKKFKIHFCDNIECENKLIKSAKIVTDIENYFHSKKDKNGNINMKNINVKRKSEKEIEESESKKRNILNENEEFLFDAMFDAKTVIYINHKVIWRIFSKFFDIFREFIFYIAIGPTKILIWKIDKWKDEFPVFRAFLTEVDLRYEYQLKVKTNIEIIDNNMFFEEEWIDDEMKLILKSEVNLLRLTFQNLDQLINFIRKLDLEYLFMIKNLEEPHMKKSLYSVLTLSEDRIKKIKSTGTSDLFIEHFHLLFRETIDEYLTRHPQMTDINKYLEKLKKLDIEKQKKDHIERQESHDQQRKKEGLKLEKLEYKTIFRNYKKIHYIDPLINYIDEMYDIPENFINSFADNFIDGVDIFTIIHAFITNTNTDWEFEFDLKIENQKDRKVNFMEYLFYYILDIKNRLIILYSHHEKVRLFRVGSPSKSIKQVVERQLLYFYFKLSTIIPVFFGVLNQNYLIYKKYKKIDEFYEITKKLGENLTYIILKVQDYNERMPPFSNTKETDMRLSLINKYHIFNISTFSGNIGTNFTNTDFIGDLNALEQNYVTLSNGGSIIKNPFYFVRDKMEMWLFYFMTGVFTVNYSYLNNSIKEHSSNLYKFNFNAEKRNKLFLQMFNYSMDDIAYKNTLEKPNDLKLSDIIENFNGKIVREEEAVLRKMKKSNIAELLIKKRKRLKKLMKEEEEKKLKEEEEEKTVIIIEILIYGPDLVDVEWESLLDYEFFDKETKLKYRSKVNFQETDEQLTTEKLSMMMFMESEHMEDKQINTNI